MTNLPRSPAGGADATPLDVLLAGAAAAVPAALIAAAVPLAFPHVRGLGFFPALRFAVTTPVTLVTAVGGAFVFRALAARSAHPRRDLALALAVPGFLLVAAAALVGAPGLVAPTLVTVLATAAALSWWIPRGLSRTRRSPVRAVITALVGALELGGVVGARSTEHVAPPGPSGLAFEIPRSQLDVEHRFVDLPGGARVHYVDEGQGETLLFLHGNPSWSFQWRTLIAGLRGSFRCVALDYPGFGLSRAPAGFGFTPDEESRVVERFVDQLGLHDVTLVMQDWGGPIGLAVAGRRPELVRRVILGSTWAWTTTTAEPRGKFSVLVGGPLGEFLQMNFGAFVAAGIGNGVVHPLPPDVFALYTRPFRPLDHRGIAAFYPGQITAATDFFAEVERGLARVRDRPALVFWAGRDRGFPRADLAKWEAAFPDHRTVELPEADHFFFEDTAPEMLTEMRAFLAATPERARAEKR